jgi:transcriptional regulator with XRE-family HTH domain
MSIGKQIKSYRKQKGFTQEGLAMKANISRSYLADVERDRYNPSLDTLTRIAAALEIESGLLLKPDSDPNSTLTPLEKQFLRTTLEMHLESYNLKNSDEKALFQRNTLLTTSIISKLNL